MTTAAKQQRMAKVTADVKFGATMPYDQQSEWQQKANGYTVTLRYRGRQMTLDFWMGQAHTSEPTAGDVLEAILSDASSADETFEDWCDNYGYDTDSRQAERTYTAVREQTAKVRRLLGEDFDAAMYDEDWLAWHTANED